MRMEQISNVLWSTVVMAILGLPLVTASSQCKWPDDSDLIGCGTPWSAEYSDCQSGTFSPIVETKCGDVESGATDCYVENVPLTMTVKYWTPYPGQNGGGSCGLPYSSRDYDAGTCKQAVLFGAPCPTSEYQLTKDTTSPRAQAAPA